MNRDETSVEERNSARNKEKVRKSLENGIIDETAYYNMTEYKQLDPLFRHTMQLIEKGLKVV